MSEILHNRSARWKIQFQSWGSGESAKKNAPLRMRFGATESDFFVREACAEGRSPNDRLLGGLLTVAGTDLTPVLSGPSSIV